MRAELEITNLNGGSNVNDSLLNGRIFARDTTNSSIVSDGDVVAPRPPSLSPPALPCWARRSQAWDLLFAGVGLRRPPVRQPRSVERGRGIGASALSDVKANEVPSGELKRVLVGWVRQGALVGSYFKK